MRKINRFFILLFLLPLCLLLTGFSQEYLIFLKNLDHAKIVTLDQIIQESGLKMQKTAVLSEQVPTNQAISPDAAPKKIPSVNKQLSIPENQDFSVNIQLVPEKEFAVLKSIQGDTRYQKDRSKTDKGNFIFHSGKADSKVTFQVVDISGYPIRNQFYFIRIQGAQQPAPSQTTRIVQQAGPLQTAQVVETNNPASPAENQTGSVTNQGSQDIDTSALAIASVEGMQPTEAARALTKLLDSPNLSPLEKEKMRYKLVDILLDQRSFTQSQTQINLIATDAVKALYTARFFRAKKSYQEAYKNYIRAFSGDEATQKSAVLESEETLLTIGHADKSAIELLTSETKKMKNDSKFYGRSMIRIARLEQYIPDIYAAKDILTGIIDGSYDASVKEEASRALDELNNGFLDYH